MPGERRKAEDSSDQMLLPGEFSYGPAKALAYLIFYETTLSKLSLKSLELF